MRRGGEPIGPEGFDAAFGPLLPAPGSILLAVSGGPDSTALLFACAAWARRHRVPAPAVATVDHGLRAESRAEAEAVRVAAEGLGLRHHRLPWCGDRPLRPSQEAARRARYRLLAGLAAEIGSTALVTAHTLDDQAETVLMRVAAGSGLAGLAGMRPVVRPAHGIPHHRPFLGFTKAELVATCRAGGWSFVEDPSNGDPRYARARWRRLAAPLAAEGLDGRRLANLSLRAARADAALDHTAAAAFARLGAEGHGTVRIDARALAAEPEEIALRVLLLALGRTGEERTGGAPLRLERAEAALAALLAASAAGQPRRRTLAGCLLALDGSGTLTLSPEPARRRGRSPVTPIAAASPHSLGIGEARP